MATTGLGGFIKLDVRCQTCNQQVLYDSDPSGEGKHQVVAAYRYAGSDYAKYRRVKNHTGLASVYFF